jgi:hypothetical protein
MADLEANASKGEDGSFVNSVPISGRTGIVNDLSKTTGVQEEFSPGYQVLDWKSANSAFSISRRSSVASTRGQNPLSTVARKKMKAIKKIGACWRCKFLRKSVTSSRIPEGFLLTLGPV